MYQLIGLTNHINTLCWRDVCVWYGRGFGWSCLSCVSSVDLISAGQHTAHPAAAQEYGQAVSL